ncbi:unnamed protein product [marine sediment metagenome]|uniref:Uncharacterized protein n=1 Tax=marine sediment metagenome TaxID=412755 RepID=X1HV09_9ZZZZ
MQITPITTDASSAFIPTHIKKIPKPSPAMALTIEQKGILHSPSSIFMFK